jgi:hypothetical protein
LIAGVLIPVARRSLGALLAACLALPAAPVVHAQSVAPADGEAYQDRLLAGGQLPAQTSSERDGRLDQTGNLRSLVVELGGSIIAPRSRSSDFDLAAFDRMQREAGLSVSGRYQTDNFGLLTLDAQVRASSRSDTIKLASGRTLGGSATLGSRNLPLGGGWQADTTAGMTTAPAIALVRQQPRFFIPTFPIAGAAITVRSFARTPRQTSAIEPEPVATATFAVGEPGLLGGMRLSDFSGLSGRLYSAGGQARLSPRLSAGVQAIAVEGTRDPYAAIFAGTGDPVARLSSRGVLATAAYGGPGLRLQANAIWSRQVTRLDGHVQSASRAGGGWLDASYRARRTVHNAGVYYFGPDLAWGNSAIVNNAYGAYYRMAGSSQRWRWSLAMDTTNSVRRDGTRGTLVNGDVRRQVSFRTSVGANAAFRVTNGYRSSQLLGYIDRTSGLGATRLEAGWSHDLSADLYRAGWDQAWTLPAWMPPGSRLSSQVTFDRLRPRQGGAPGSGRAARSNSVGFGISAGVSPFSAFSLDASAAYKSDGGSSVASIYGPVDATGGLLGPLATQRGRSLSANVVATARISSRLSLSASYTNTRSRLTTRYGLADPAISPIGVSPVDPARDQRSSFRLQAGYVTLRFGFSAGRAKSSIGVRAYPVGGTGALQGRVFLDANGNGRRDAAEAGAAGIMVILDGVFAVRTDQAGYYRFDDVADGQHRVTVNYDALPLPWTIAAPDKPGTGAAFSARVEVGVRSSAQLDIAATRE